MSTGKRCSASFSSWRLVQSPLSARIAQACSYTADPVTLPLSVEQRLNDLMEEA